MMPEWIRSVVKVVVVLSGLLVIYLLINGAIQATNDSIQDTRNSEASAVIVNSYISAEPFGAETAIVQRDSQIFYNIKIHRKEGEPCFVRTSWRWTLHLPTGNSVMWNTSDGEFYAGDKTEKLAQAVQVPERLIPGDYTLSRLAVFKCGDVENFATTVRNTDLRVE